MSPSIAPAQVVQQTHVQAQTPAQQKAVGQTWQTGKVNIDLTNLGKAPVQKKSVSMNQMASPNSNNSSAMASPIGSFGMPQFGMQPQMQSQINQMPFQERHHI
jgi:hypothetical protein